MTKAILLAAMIASTGAVLPASASVLACDPVMLMELSRGDRLDPGVLRLQVLNQQYLRLYLVDRVESGCGARIRYFDGSSRMLLDSGKTVGFDRRERGGITTGARDFQPINAQAIRTALPAGNAGEGRFVFSTQIGTRREDGISYTEHLGIWHTGDGWEVRGFLMRGDAIAKPTKPILRSAQPVRSISYSPLPDAARGYVHLMIDPGPGDTLIAHFYWSHVGFFKTG